MFEKKTYSTENGPRWKKKNIIPKNISLQKFLSAKLSRRNLGRRRFQRQSLEEESSKGEPRMKPT